MDQEMLTYVDLAPYCNVRWIKRGKERIGGVEGVYLDGAYLRGGKLEGGGLFLSASGRGTRLHFLCRTVYPSSALRRALPRSGRVSRLRQFSGAVPVSVCGRGGAGRKMLF